MGLPNTVSYAAPLGHSEKYTPTQRRASAISTILLPGGKRFKCSRKRAAALKILAPMRVAIVDQFSELQGIDVAPW